MTTTICCPVVLNHVIVVLTDRLSADTAAHAVRTTYDLHNNSSASDNISRLCKLPPSESSPIQAYTRTALSFSSAAIQQQSCTTFQTSRITPVDQHNIPALKRFKRFVSRDHRERTLLSIHPMYNTLHHKSGVGCLDMSRIAQSIVAYVICLDEIAKDSRNTFMRVFCHNVPHVNVWVLYTSVKSNTEYPSLLPTLETYKAVYFSSDCGDAGDDTAGGGGSAGTPILMKTVVPNPTFPEISSPFWITVFASSTETQPITINASEAFFQKHIYPSGADGGLGLFMSLGSRAIAARDSYKYVLSEMKSGCLNPEDHQMNTNMSRFLWYSDKPHLRQPLYPIVAAVSTCPSCRTYIQPKNADEPSFFSGYIHTFCEQCDQLLVRE